MLDGLRAVLLAVLECAGELGVCGEWVECGVDWGYVGGGGGVSLGLCVGVDESSKEGRGEEEGGVMWARLVRP